MEPGCVVEFIDSQKIICAVVLEVKKLRLRLLTENNREIKISAGRLLHRCDRTLNPALGREKLVAMLKQTATLRRSLSEQIDIAALWQVLNSEQELIDPATMVSFCFTDKATADHESAVIRAFFDDRLFFKFSPEGFLPHTEEQVDQIKAQRDAQTRREKLVELGGVWIQRTLKGQSTAPPEQADAIKEFLISYYLYEKESPHRDMAKALLDRAGETSIASIRIRSGL